jgi:hypothetical protein
MRVHTIGGQEYRLPDHLNEFQLLMYVHLINWKWRHITRVRGRNSGFEYDAILPDSYADEFRVLYPGVVAAIRTHHNRFPFRMHKHFNHMASSQAANINLFLPILLDARANAILGALNHEFARLATEYLDHGWRIEFWDEPFGGLSDKKAISGTDADMAIAYYNHYGMLCLWLIEHKLAEPEFTTCGGFKSKGRQERHDCTRSFSEILKNKGTCYYHDVCKYTYWNVTEANRDFFVNHTKHTECPFQGGLNQLWRNQLLSLVVEQDERQPYKHTNFSVVRHPGNKYLAKTLTAYKDLTNNNPRFLTFTSAEVIDAAERHADEGLRDWIAWYKGFYRL